MPTYGRELAGGKPTPAGLRAIALNRALFARVWALCNPGPMDENNKKLFTGLRQLKDAIGALYASETVCPGFELPSAEHIAGLPTLEIALMTLHSISADVCHAPIPDGATGASRHWHKSMCDFIYTQTRKCMDDMIAFASEIPWAGDAESGAETDAAMRQ